jgi:hypothetical protein
MRLLVEIFVIGVLISLGWNTPFKEWEKRATTVIQTFVPKRQSGPSPGVITIVTRMIPWETERSLRNCRTKMTLNLVAA